MQAGVASTGRPGVGQAIDELDLGALGRALWRKKHWIIGLTLLAAALAFVAVNLITPRYKSEARILIETRENIFLRPDADKSSERGATVDQEAVTSQVQLILSREVAREVIRKLKLGERPEFDPVLRGMSLPKVVLVHLGFMKDPMEQTPEERVLKSYYDRLTAFQVEKSRVVVIEFKSEDPELAAQVTNTVAETYLSMQQSSKQDQSRSAGQWLSGEIDSLRRKVADAESKVEQYRARTNLFVGNNNTTLSNQQLGDFNGQLSSARALKSDAESKARIIRETLKSGAPIEFSDVTNSELMRRLSEQRVTLRGQLAEQSSTLLDQHPRIKELRAQIGDLERQQRIEADRLARSFEADARLADARMQSLSTGMDQLKRQAANTNEEDVQLRALEREAKSQRDLLESYLAKYREASARDNIGAASPEARIISPAIVSNTPAYPRKLPTILVAALGMFVLSSGFILSGELFGALSTAPVAAAAPEPIEETERPDHTEALAARIRAVTNHATAAAPPPAPDAAAMPPTVATPPAAAATVETTPVGGASEPPVNAASVPVAPPAPEPARARPMAELQTVGVAPEAVEGLARELAASGDAARRITVVGTRRNVGTTLAAIALARDLAKQGRVALIDLAFGSPNLAAIATDGAAPGIGELVRGTTSFGQIITRDRFSRVHIITAGQAADAHAILAAQRLSITIEALGRSYDHVVVDAGALPDVSPERFAQLAPRAVLIAEGLDHAATGAARERLIGAGFNGVSVLAGAPRGPELGATKTSAAA